MTESFIPPSGPPPPKVPEGWKAQWNEQYSEWFYVNIYTKKSQWERPNEPVYPPGESADGAPSEPPPGYSGGGAHQNPTDVKHNPYDTKPNTETDEELARRLQAEEDARGSSSGNRNAQQDYMNTPMPPGQSSSPYPQQPQYQQQSPFPQQYPEQSAAKDQKKGGFLGKLLGKATGGSSSHGAGMGSFGRPQQAGYGGYPQQQFGGGYGQPGHGQPGYGYGGNQYGRPQKAGGGGMGMAGGAALGLGGGLIGGALIANAMDDHDQNEYQEGYQDGQDNDYGGDDGGDFGGDDGGGGDF